MTPIKKTIEDERLIKKWEPTLLLDDMESEADRLRVADALEELSKTVKWQKGKVPPAILYIFKKMVYDGVARGDTEWFLNSCFKYYEKNPMECGYEKEDHWDPGVMHFRIHDYFRWLEKERSMLL